MLTSPASTSRGDLSEDNMETENAAAAAAAAFTASSQLKEAVLGRSLQVSHGRDGRGPQGRPGSVPARGCWGAPALQLCPLYLS